MRYRKKNPTPEMSAWKVVRQSNSSHKVYNHTYTVGKAKIRAVVGFYPGPGGRGGGYVSRIDVRQGRDMTEYLVEHDGGLRPILNLPVGTPRAPVPDFSSPEAAIAATAVATQLIEASLLKRNPMSAAERKQYEREVEAYLARKALERDVYWQNYPLREEEEAGGRKKAERRRNPLETFDTCPSYMDYDWWVEHYAPQHVRDEARRKALEEAQRKYALPPLTPQQRLQVQREEAAYGRAMRKDAARRNPGVDTIVVAALPYIRSHLGAKLDAFNALPYAQRKARVRTFLTSKDRWSLGVGGGILAPQVARSDAAVSGIVHALEKHGHAAIEAVKKNPRRC